MNYEVTGKLVVKEDVIATSEKFSKREIVLEVINEKNEKYNDFIKVQLTQDRCDLVDKMSINDMLKVSFNLRGRKWENNGQTSYFTNLEGWRVEKVGGSPAKAPEPTYSEPSATSQSEVDDLPF